MTKKQFYEILESIEEGSSKKWKANYSKYRDRKMSNTFVKTYKEDVMYAGFSWGHTPEGFEYWFKINNKFQELYND
jgi:hypothetical protein